MDSSQLKNALRKGFRELERLAPPAPIEDLHRLILADQEPQEHVVHWWEPLWEQVEGRVPGVPEYSFAATASRPGADRGDKYHPIMVPAVADGGEHSGKAVILVTGKPVVGPQRKLVMGLLAQPNVYPKAELLEVQLCNRDREPVGDPVTVSAGQEFQLSVKLTPRQFLKWRDIASRSEESLDLVFAVRPADPDQAGDL